MENSAHFLVEAYNPLSAKEGLYCEQFWVGGRFASEEWSEGCGIEHEDKLLIRDDYFLFLVFEIHEEVSLGEFCLDEFCVNIESHQFPLGCRLYGKELSLWCEYNLSGGKERTDLCDVLSLRVYSHQFVEESSEVNDFADWVPAKVQ